MAARSPWWIPLFFFASGASGLIYEVIWVRRFGSLFGSTVYSAALVTGIFVCGLGLGGYVAGRWADRRLGADASAPLRAYGFFELAIAALAACIDRLLPALGDLAAAVASYQAGEHGWYWLAPASSWVRYACAAGLLFPVTCLMGGTLTLLIRDRVREDVSRAGWDVSVLYGVNTAGAALGCLLTDLWLVPHLGVRATQLLAVGLNAFAGLGALALARSRSTPRAEPAPVPAAPRAPLEPALASLAVALGLGGFAAMAFQILWFRHLVAFFGAYRPVFSILLTVILLGIWLGSWLGGALAQRVRRPAALQGLALAGFVVASLGALVAAEGSRDALGRAASGSPPWSYYEMWFRAVLALVFLPSFFSGAAFPLANAIAQREASRVGERAGVLYLASTVGGVLGALAAGFWMLPQAGIQASGSLVTGAVLLAIVALWHAMGRFEPTSRPAALVALGVGVLALGAWQRLPSGRLLERSLWASVGPGDRVVALDEGVGETLAVVEKPGPYRMLVTNGHPMSGTGPGDQRYMRAFAHVPLLLVDSIETVMVMCFGVGNTIDATLAHPSVRRVDVVDVSSDVLDASPHFGASNGDPLADPRVRVHVNDARLHLRMLSGETYDLITGEPPPISHAGVVNLYSREFFELARSRLRPGGFLTYWLPIYQVGEGAARSVVRTFLDVFPGAVLLSGYRNELLLVGRKDAPVVLDPVALQRRIDADPALRRELRWISLERTADWAALLAGSTATLEAATRGALPVTDDRPLLEYANSALTPERRLPADLFGVEDVEAWCPTCLSTARSAHERDEIAGSLEVIGAYYRSGAFLQPRTPAIFSPRLSARGRRAVGESLYLRDLLGVLPVGQRSAAMQLRNGRPEEALASVSAALQERPGDVLLRLDLADLLALAGREDAARAERVEVLRRDPDEERARVGVAASQARDRSDPLDCPFFPPEGPMPLRNVVLVDGARTAFARGAKGKLVATRLDDAGGQVVRALLDRNPKVKDSMIEDAGLGNVGGWGEFTGLGVMARLAGLPLEVCSFNSNRQCGSSMETLQRIAMAIEVGTIECGLALGAERMGRGLGGGATGPQNRNTKLNPRLFQMNDVQKRMAPDHDQTFSVPFPDYILNSPPLQAMVQTAQNAAECYGLTRAELDAFSAESHRKAAAATAAGVYKDEIIPIEVEDPVFDEKGEWNENETGKKVLFEKDECIRADTTAEKLAALQPVKGVISFGGKEIIITAGNSCPTNDAVSAALLMSETLARKLGLTPLARVLGIAVAGVKPQVMGLGPIPSTKKALRHAGIEAGQLDRVEFNEAFAAQVIPSCKDLGIPLSKVNVNGGSIAIGHPLGATGARLVTTVAKELRRSGGRYALATQCIGAGMGISTILERME